MPDGSDVQLSLSNKQLHLLPVPFLPTVQHLPPPASQNNMTQLYSSPRTELTMLMDYLIYFHENIVEKQTFKEQQKSPIVAQRVTSLA